jgi:integral membrane protein
MKSALKFYRVTSYVTGTFLLLLCLEMLVRYAFGHDLILGGTHGFLALEARGEDGSGLVGVGGLNVSTGILIVHGWLYVAYLFGDYRMWTLYRWSFTRFVIIALGGVIPLLSFFTERHFTKVALAQLTATQAKAANV